jgi:predicted DNA-binding transcriptional regulator AlpA
MTTIAVLDEDQLREIVRTEVIRALDEFREILHATAMDTAEDRRNPDVLDGGLMTAKALAETTGISPRELRRLVLEGLFPAPIRLGTRRVRWKRKEVLDWMKQAPRSTDPAPRVRLPERLARH